MCSLLAHLQLLGWYSLLASRPHPIVLSQLAATKACMRIGLGTVSPSRVSALRNGQHLQVVFSKRACIIIDPTVLQCHKYTSIETIRDRRGGGRKAK